ncbi:sirohydrochlorin cobaltochelatase [Desulfopila aestuarii]|uniref:Sirohydrochlorin cobaltochelatase n=1 Tax=Desulfopila aestuarii DSM 18488 TaxID=1121416 RepID=A0A1M7XVR2_9BACT|nr:sirohydrochlorin cobaltochelatase [Desulfopila aestuarii]SHO42713.1 sirohydrochlorin cobaltochelatase [Desulfopila aestuarii DSM 18488]
MSLRVRMLLICSVLSLAILVCLPTNRAQASSAKPKEVKSAIVLAHFGTTVPAGLESIINIDNAVRKAYPNTEVRITFTSNIIRSVWKKRQADPQKWLDQGIPKEVLYVKNVIATIGDLLEEGYSNIIVQPSHMFYMEQSYDLQQYVNGLASITTMKERWKPFTNLVMGRPALGAPGDQYPYHEDIDAVVKTLADDAAMAEKEGALLVYMGHGNEHWSTGIYAETVQKMRKVYPKVKTFIGVVEGVPSVEDTLLEIQQTGNRKVILRPFMIVAGDHATNDMAGDEEDSWKSILTKAGYEVQPVLQGLGSNNAFAQIFVDHIADAAKEKGIELK